LDAQRKLIEGELTGRIIGCAMEVHKNLGPGFLESAYSDALAYEFAKAGLQFEREKEMPVNYKDIVLKSAFRADFVVEKKVVVENKAIEALAKIHDAKVINYLKSGGLRVGLLFNFGEPSLSFRRFVN
jgi:GxxExxY protein